MSTFLLAPPVPVENLDEAASLAREVGALATLASSPEIRAELVSGLQDCESVLSVDPTNERALDVSRQILDVATVEPDNPVFHQLQGRLHLKNGDYQEAGKALARAGECYHKQWKAVTDCEDLLSCTKACQAFEASLELLDGTSLRKALSRYIDTLVDLERYEEAKTAAIRLSEMGSSSPAEEIRRAQILGVLGHEQEAEALCRSVLIDHPDCAPAYKFLPLLSSYQVDEKEVVQFTQALSQSEEGSIEQATISMGLARVLDKMERFDEAFHHFERGNKIFHSQFGWSQEDLLAAKEYPGEVRERFGQGGELRDTDSIYDTSQPFQMIFIVGMPRSGTTLLHQMIASHLDPDGQSRVLGGGELVTISHLKHIVRNQFGWSPDRQTQRMLTNTFFRTVVSDLQISEDARPTHVVSKLPSDFQHLDMIRLLVPGAIVINMERDPQATCFSMYTRFFGGGDFGYSYDLEQLGEYYRDVYLPLMEYWREVLPPDGITQVRYEDLVSDPESILRKILSQCNLPFSENCLQHHKAQLSSRTDQRAHRPIYQDSKEHWRLYQHHLSPLLRVLP